MFDLGLILPATILGISRMSDTPGHLHLPLENNTNDKKTVFAGSIFSLAALSGYDTVHERQKERGLSGDLFLVSSTIAYHQPGLSDLIARSEALSDLVLTTRANYRMRVKIRVFDDSGEKKCASFEGIYVVKTVRPGNNPPPPEGP